MSPSKHIPQHYMIEIKPPDTASMYLDTHYGMGWRVAQTVPHTDGHQLIFLLEKTGPQKQ
jgi:hypothetical protein